MQIPSLLNSLITYPLFVNKPERNLQVNSRLNTISEIGSKLLALPVSQSIKLKSILFKKIQNLPSIFFRNLRFNTVDALASVLVVAFIGNNIKNYFQYNTNSLQSFNFNFSRFKDLSFKSEYNTAIISKPISLCAHSVLATPAPLTLPHFVLATPAPLTLPKEEIIGDWRMEHSFKPFSNTILHIALFSHLIYLIRMLYNRQIERQTSPIRVIDNKSIDDEKKMQPLTELVASDVMPTIPESLSPKEKLDKWFLQKCRAYLLDPFTEKPMVDPVILSDGHTYEKELIKEIIKQDIDEKYQPTSPTTGETLKKVTPTDFYVPNWKVRQIANAIANKPNDSEAIKSLQEQMNCAVTCAPFDDPRIIGDGHTYDDFSISGLIEEENNKIKSPHTREIFDKISWLNKNVKKIALALELYDTIKEKENLDLPSDPFTNGNGHTSNLDDEKVEKHYQAPPMPLDSEDEDGFPVENDVQPDSANELSSEDEDEPHSV